jgi:hypothetical protein
MPNRNWSDEDSEDSGKSEPSDACRRRRHCFCAAFCQGGYSFGGYRREADKSQLLDGESKAASQDIRAFVVAELHRAENSRSCWWGRGCCGS